MRIFSYNLLHLWENWFIIDQKLNNGFKKRAILVICDIRNIPQIVTDVTITTFTHMNALLYRSFFLHRLFNGFLPLPIVLSYLVPRWPLFRNTQSSKADLSMLCIGSERTHGIVITESIAWAVDAIISQCNRNYVTSTRPKIDKNIQELVCVFEAF